MSVPARTARPGRCHRKHRERRKPPLVRRAGASGLAARLAPALVFGGRPVVIAGLTVTERGEIVSGIPLLMRLPLVGRLFRSRTESMVRRDLVIMVTPTIVSPAPP